ncbi:unnamed protein product, partial [Didymodactylos carnosus]
SRVLTRVSPTTGTHHVFIGLQKPDDFERWDNLTSDWFTEAHYIKVYLPHRRTSTSRDRSNRPDHLSHRRTSTSRDRSNRPDHSSHRRTSTSRDRSNRPDHSAHQEAFDPRSRP